MKQKQHARKNDEVIVVVCMREGEDKREAKEGDEEGEDLAYAEEKMEKEKTKRGGENGKGEDKATTREE